MNHIVYSKKKTQPCSFSNNWNAYIKSDAGEFMMKYFVPRFSIGTRFN